MALVESKIPAKQPDQIVPVEIYHPEHKTTVVDTRYTPKAALLTSIEGRPWKVNYYSQVINEDDEVTGQSQSMDPIYQEYRLINNMILKVTSPLTMTQSKPNNTLELRGTSNAYPFLRPNSGDMFVADIGDGRSGIFKVNSVERKSIFKETTYQLEYALIDYATDGVENRLADLNRKVVKRLYFRRDFLEHGQHPYIEEEDYAILKNAEGNYHRLTNDYFHMFCNEKYKTFIIPEQEFVIYDHFFTKEIMRWFSVNDYTNLQRMNVMNCDDEPVINKGMSLWTVIAEQNPHLLKRCSEKMGLINRYWFTCDPLLEGIRFSPIDYVVYPYSPDTEIFDIADRVKNGIPPLSDIQIRSLSALEAPQNDDGETDDEEGTKDEETIEEPFKPSVMIHPVTIDDYYVLSEAFYKQDHEKQSLLEVCLWNYLQKEPNAYHDIALLIQDVENWGSLEKFYYYPILLVLVNTIIRDL